MDEKKIVLIHSDYDLVEALGKSSILDFIENFLGQFISPDTKRAYIKDLIVFFRYLNKIGVSAQSPKDITPKVFQSYRDHMIQDSYSSATVNRRLVAIRSFMKWALASGHIEKNPLEVVRLPRIQTEKPTQALSDEEVVQLLEAAKDNPHHKLILILLLQLGLRRSELVNIRLKDIYEDRNHKILQIRGKGSKIRSLPLNDFIFNEISYYLNFLASSGVILKNEDNLLRLTNKVSPNKAINPATIYRIVSLYAKKCHINKTIGAHSCRATVISHLLDTHNIPIRDVAIFAGHTNVNTTERYDKRRENLDKSAAYKVNYKKAN